MSQGKKTPGQIAAEMREQVFKDVPNWKKMSGKQRRQHEEFAQLFLGATLQELRTEEQGYLDDIVDKGLAAANREALGV